MQQCPDICFSLCSLLYVNSQKSLHSSLDGSALKTITVNNEKREIKPLDICIYMCYSRTIKKV